MSQVEEQAQVFIDALNDHADVKSKFLAEARTQERPSQELIVGLFHVPEIRALRRASGDDDFLAIMRIATVRMLAQ